MWSVLQACALLAVGFASGWIAAYRATHVDTLSTRMAPSCSLSVTEQPVAARKLLDGTRMQQANESQPTAAGVAHRPIEPSLTPSPKLADSSLIGRIYPLHSSGVRWDSLPLSNHHVILVTGPQRSGTTWVSCALASSLGYSLYDERHPLTAGNDTLVSLRRAFTYARTQSRGSIIQAPMATSVLHELPLFPGLVILFIARHCLDVFRSQNRVMPHRGGWTCVAGRTKELRKYRLRAELTPHFDERDMICTIKQHAWQRFQKPVLEQRVRDASRRQPYSGSGLAPLPATIDFASFRSHPLWHGEAERRNLTIKRTAGAHCARLLRASTPPRNKARLTQWAESITESQVASRVAHDRWD
jgi:hypothetical protein